MTSSVRDLQIGEMINVSDHWLGPQKTKFLSIAEIAPLYGRVEAVHVALVAARDGDAGDTALRALGDKAEALDFRHDHLMRALHYLLLAGQHFQLGKDPADKERAADIERAQDTLYPNQLQGVLASYQAEAGNAAQLAKLASSDFKDLLPTLLLDKDTSALDLAHMISDVGRKLGQVEHQRAAAAAAAKKTDIPRAEVRRRMRDWAAVVEAVLANLAQSAAQPEAIEAIRQPVLAAAEKATARRRAKRAAKDKAPPLDTSES
jgi:hypothetical protein